VRCWVWPGNTNDISILPEVKDGLRGWRLGRVVIVVDRGFSSDANLDYLRRAGGHWIAGEKMRDGSPDAQAALSRQGRYQAVRDNLRVKEVRLGDDTGKRWIVCHNPHCHEAERDAAQREAVLERIEAELERIRVARERDAKKAKNPKRGKGGSENVFE
jgi:Transposase DDE domain